jgi:hypothetical protein
MTPFSRREFAAALPGLFLFADAASQQEMPKMTAELKPCYRVRFSYPDGWEVALGPDGSTESQSFFFAEGRCDGRLRGRFRGANHPRRRSDGAYEPDFQGVIETDDKATIYFDYRGYGRAYPVGRRQIVLFATHLSRHQNYRWLNDVVCAGIGEVRSPKGGTTELVIDLMELVWHPIAE